MLGAFWQGEWSLYSVLFSFAIIFLSFGLPQSLVHFVAAKKMDDKGLVWQTLYFSFFIAFIFSVLIALVKFSGSLEFIFSKNIPSGFFMLVLFLQLFFLLLNQFYASLLLSKKYYTLNAKISAFSAILFLFTYLVFYNKLEHKVLSTLKLVMIANVLIAALQSFIYLFQFKSKAIFSLKIDKIQFSIFRPLINFSILIFTANSIQFLTYKMDIWFLSAYWPKNEVGIYSFTVSIVQLIWLIPAAFHQIIYTESSSNANALDNNVLKWAKQILIFSSIVGVLLYVFLFVVKDNLPKEYHDIYKVAIYILPGIILFSPGMLMSAFFAAKNKVQYNLASTLVGFVISFILYTSFIPVQGKIGAAIATSISYMLSSVVLMLFYFKKFNKTQR